MRMVLYSKKTMPLTRSCQVTKCHWNEGLFLYWMQYPVIAHNLLWGVCKVLNRTPLSTDPPPSAPTITGYTAGEMKQAGERLTLTCTVSGGKPLVTSVNFLCNRHPGNKTDVRGQNKVQSVLDIRSLEPEDDAMSCVCTGDWMNRDFYKLSETITLRVNGKKRIQRIG